MAIPNARNLKAALALGAAALANSAAAALNADRTLVLYNSQNAESLAVRNAYVAAHPGVREFNLNNATLGTGLITRTDYNAKIHDPLKAFLTGLGPGGVPLNQHILAIATTRGIPARVDGGGEFAIECAIASVESELTLLQQDLEAPGQSNLPNRFHSLCDNPYHRSFATQIDSFPRGAITTQRSFTYVSPGFWVVAGLTAGDIYLVCRLDSAPTVGGASALQNTLALINRSQSLRVDPCQTQSLLDEYSCPNQFDDDSFTGFFPGFPDFENTRTALQNVGHSVTYDATANFVDWNELPSGRPLLVYGGYGENHSANGCGDNPAGTGTYPMTYQYNPAAVFISYESFNGNSIIDGTQRGGQAQVLDFIAAGGSFTVGHVAEPFTFSVADLEGLSRGLYIDGLSFAEAAYIAMPGLSWMQTPVGDPLARVVIGAGFCNGDSNGDHHVDFVDLNNVLSDFGRSGACLAGDVNRDGRVDFLDLNVVLSAFGTIC